MGEFCIFQTQKLVANQEAQSAFWDGAVQSRTFCCWFLLGSKVWGRRDSLITEGYWLFQVKCPRIYRKVYFLVQIVHQAKSKFLPSNPRIFLVVKCAHSPQLPGGLPQRISLAGDVHVWAWCKPFSLTH